MTDGAATLAAKGGSPVQDGALDKSRGKPVSGLAIILAGVLTLVLIAIVASNLKDPDPTVDIDAVLGSEISLGALPFGMDLLHAQKVGGGKRVALFGVPGDLPDPEEMGPEIKSMGGKDWGGGGGGNNWRSRRFGGGGGSLGKFNADSPWLKVPEPMKGESPWQMSLVHYTGGAEKKLRSEFGQLNFKDLSQLPESGGSTPLRTGQIVWHGYRLPFVVVRHFRKVDKRPTYHDSVRVNLTRGRHALVLYARWKPEEAANIDALQELVGALVPKESPEALAKDA